MSTQCWTVGPVLVRGSKGLPSAQQGRGGGSLPDFSWAGHPARLTLPAGQDTGTSLSDGHSETG